VEAAVSSSSSKPIKPENHLSQFSGEPQIVESFTISQLTPREPTSLVASGSSLHSTMSTADNFKGTYDTHFLLHIRCILDTSGSESLSHIFSEITLSLLFGVSVYTSVLFI
jgi:hypothetical protein